MLAWIRESESWLVQAAMKMHVDHIGRTLRLDLALPLASLWPGLILGFGAYHLGIS